MPRQLSTRVQRQTYSGWLCTCGCWCFGVSVCVCVCALASHFVCADWIRFPLLSLPLSLENVRLYLRSYRSSHFECVHHCERLEEGKAVVIAIIEWMHDFCGGWFRVVQDKRRSHISWIENANEHGEGFKEDKTLHWWLCAFARQILVSMMMGALKCGWKDNVTSGSAGMPFGVLGTVEFVLFASSAGGVHINHFAIQASHFLIKGNVFDTCTNLFNCICWDLCITAVARLKSIFFLAAAVAVYYVNILYSAITLKRTAYSVHGRAQEGERERER